MIRGKDIVTEMSHCNSLLSLIQCYMKAVLYCITFVSCLLFWPIAVLFIKYYNDGKYYLSKGNDTYKSTVGIRIVHLNTGWKCLIFKWQPFKNETNSSAVVMPFKIWTICEPDMFGIWFPTGKDPNTGPVQSLNDRISNGHLKSDQTCLKCLIWDIFSYSKTEWFRILGVW